MTTIRVILGIDRRVFALRNLSLAHIAKLAAKNLYCVGSAIAIVALSPLTLLRTVKADVQSSFCESIASMPEKVREFSSMLCAVREGVFADGREPTLGFKFVEPVESPGMYESIDFYGQSFSFEAVQVFVIPLHKTHPEKFTTSDFGSFCIGWLEGPAGRVPVSAICLRKESLTGDPIISVFLVTELLPDAYMLTSTKTEIILESLVTDVTDIQEFDGVTDGQTISQDEGGSSLNTKNIEELLLVTLNTPFNILALNQAEIRMPTPILPYGYKDCVRKSRQHFNVEEIKNNDKVTDCIIGALDSFESEVIFCAGAGLLGCLAGPAGAVAAYMLCVLALEQNLTQTLSGCRKDFNSQQNANQQHLALDLADCARMYLSTQPVNLP